MGIAEDARLKRDISQDQILTLDDVDLSRDKLCVQLRREQDAYFV
jgi:predicted homoserine dehydrogenase-like protein